MIASMKTVTKPAFTCFGFVTKLSAKITHQQCLYEVNCGTKTVIPCLLNQYHIKSLDTMYLCAFLALIYLELLRAERKSERSRTLHFEYCEENQPHNWEFVHTLTD